MDVITPQKVELEFKKKSQKRKRSQKETPTKLPNPKRVCRTKNNNNKKKASITAVVDKSSDNVLVDNIAVMVTDNVPESESDNATSSDKKTSTTYAGSSSIYKTKFRSSASVCDAESKKTNSETAPVSSIDAKPRLPTSANARTTRADVELALAAARKSGFNEVERKLMEQRRAQVQCTLQRKCPSKNSRGGKFSRFRGVMKFDKYGNPVTYGMMPALLSQPTPVAMDTDASAGPPALPARRAAADSTTVVSSVLDDILTDVFEIAEYVAVQRSQSQMGDDELAMRPVYATREADFQAGYYVPQTLEAGQYVDNGPVFTFDERVPAGMPMQSVCERMGADAHYATPVPTQYANSMAEQQRQHLPAPMNFVSLEHSFAALSASSLGRSAEENNMAGEPLEHTTRADVQTNWASDVKLDAIEANSSNVGFNDEDFTASNDIVNMHYDEMQEYPQPIIQDEMYLPSQQQSYPMSEVDDITNNIYEKEEQQLDFYQQDSQIDQLPINRLIAQNDQFQYESRVFEAADYANVREYQFQMRKQFSRMQKEKYQVQQQEYTRIRKETLAMKRREKAQIKKDEKLRRHEDKIYLQLQKEQDKNIQKQFLEGKTFFKRSVEDTVVCVAAFDNCNKENLAESNIHYVIGEVEGKQQMIDIFIPMFDEAVVEVVDSDFTANLSLDHLEVGEMFCLTNDPPPESIADAPSNTPIHLQCPVQRDVNKPALKKSKGRSEKKGQASMKTVEMIKREHGYGLMVEM